MLTALIQDASINSTVRRKDQLFLAHITQECLKRHARSLRARALKSFPTVPLSAMSIVINFAKHPVCIGIFPDAGKSANDTREDRGQLAVGYPYGATVEFVTVTPNRLDGDMGICVYPEQLTSGGIQRLSAVAPDGSEIDPDFDIVDAVMLRARQLQTEMNESDEETPHPWSNWLLRSLTDIDVPTGSQTSSNTSFFD